MAVRVFCNAPGALLNKIKAGISNGTVETWTIDADGDFTHCPPQWKNKAWLRPVLFEDRIVFRIIPPKGKAITRPIYGVFHGRFVEMLLIHFDLEFSRVTSTALPADGDIVKGVDG